MCPADVSHEDAQWFLQLPDKVKRGQFTTEEQILLAGGYQSVILDAADEILYKLGRHPNRSVPSLRTSFSSTPSTVSSDFEASPDSAEDMDDAIMDSFRWLDDDDLDLTLDDYHEHLAEIATQSTTSSRRPSTRRTTSLNSVSVSHSLRPSIDTRPPYSTAVARSPDTLSQTSSMPTTRRPSLSRLPSRYPSHDSFTPVDHSAKYYQDPEARLKLRVYLASPQKFDEAIEFGFPSLESSQPQRSSSCRASMSNSLVSPSNARTFLDDEKTLLSKGQDDADSTSLPETDSPHTPVDTSFQTPFRQFQPKHSTDHARPPMKHAHTEPYIMGWAGSREMTLRMTLTRPDLRADESVLYPKEKDPLALEDLHFLAEGGDIWTKTPHLKEDGMFGRLWKKVHRKMLTCD